MNVNHLYGENSTAIPGFNQSQWDNNTPEWFHGVTSRKDAETLLLCKHPGYFLVRVGESRNGFTLSYRATDRCRHFMIDALQDGNYTITGESTHHHSLRDLVHFHSRTPIMPFNEVLTLPCIKSLPLPLKMSEDTERDEDVPPALPYRTSLPSIPSLLTPSYHTDPSPNRFNSHLPDQVSHFDSRLHPLVNAVDPTPLPDHTNIYNNAQVNPASDIPAEVPRHLETNNNVLLYPTLPSSPSTSGTPTTEQGAPQDKHADPKPLVMPSQMKLMALFRKKKGETSQHHWSQESPQSVEADSSGAARLVDDGLPEEYLPPTPYAPGYC
ncbi:unnamed protein product [Lota lota]